MENATRALIIVAGVFLGLMILSLGMYLYASLGRYVEDTNQMMEENALNSFNTQFFDYINYQIGDDGKEKEIFELRIQDIITVANIAYENNNYYNLENDESYDGSTFYVAVSVDSIEGINNEERQHLEKQLNKSSELLAQNLEYKYKCTQADIKVSETTRRVYEIKFSKINEDET